MNEIGWERGKPSWSLGFLHTYPITMFFGILISFLTVVWFWRRYKYSWEVLQVVVIIIIPSAIVGARLWFLIAEGDLKQWEEFYKFSGLSIHGGVMFAILTGLIYLRTKKNVIDIRTIFGIILPTVLIGQSIGRWGNFDNHEVFGQIVSSKSLDWMGPMKSHMLIFNSNDNLKFGDPNVILGMVRMNVGPPQLHLMAYRAPLFFYESMSSLVGYIVLVWIILNFNLLKPGATGALYLIWYGVVRASMEPIRNPSDIMKWGGVFPISLFLAILSAVLGLFLLIWFQFLTKPFVKGFEKILPKKIFNFLDNKVKKEYELIKPIKYRRFAKKDTRRKYYLFGKMIPNTVSIWIPRFNIIKKSKRKLNEDISKARRKNG